MTEKKQRIIFIDLLRAFAVFMMIQGHTIHTLLSAEYRNPEYPLYSFWLTMRGFTAPIFMISAGTAFTYLLFRNGKSFAENPRIKIGIKRFVSLLIIGYLLRYPTYRIFDFRYVTRAQWETFFAVDALHLIAFGLLFLIISCYISERLKLNFFILSAALGLVSFITAPFILKIDWLKYLPLPIADYLTNAAGSIFPLLPWSGYVMLGGSLGYFISANKDVHKKIGFGISLFIIGVLFTAAAAIPELFSNSFIFERASLSFYRFGFVLILISLISYISIYLETIPNFFKLLGRHSLGIYAVHLIILYGCAWFPGLWKYYKFSFNLTYTLVSVVIMIFLMFGFAIIFEKYGNRPKELVYKIFNDR